LEAETFDVEEPVVGDGDDAWEEYGDEEEDFGEWDQEYLEGQEWDQAWEDVQPEEWRHEEGPQQWYPLEAGPSGFDQGALEVDPVSLARFVVEEESEEPVSLTREEFVASVQDGAENLTEEAREIVSSVRDKIQGNQALALSIIHELQSLQWAGAGSGTAGNADIGAEWAEKYGAGDWASQYGAGDWASQYTGGAAEASSLAFGDNIRDAASNVREAAGNVRDNIASRIHDS